MVMDKKVVNVYILILMKIIAQLFLCKFNSCVNFHYSTLRSDFYYISFYHTPVLQ